MFGGVTFPFVERSIWEGIVAAIVLCLTGFWLSLKATRDVEKMLSRRGQLPGVSGVFAGVLVRMAVAVVGLVAVYFFFGRARAVPCALAMMPLCFLEVMCGMAVQLRRVKRCQKTVAAEPVTAKTVEMESKI